MGIDTTNLFSIKEEVKVTPSIDFNYLESDIKESLMSSIQAQVILGKSHILEALFTQCTLVKPHFIFTEQAVFQLGTQLFDNPEVRDATYEILSELKFNLSVKGHGYKDLAYMIVRTGHTDIFATDGEISGNWHVDEKVANIFPSMDNFNSAYIVDESVRAEIIYAYEWLTVLYLLRVNLAWLMINYKTMLEEVAKISKTILKKSEEA